MKTTLLPSNDRVMISALPYDDKVNRKVTAIKDMIRIETPKQSVLFL
tara:strand:- start:401 stop:541 length:141 start_codon:yes stop_codon:yes gene_type:complete